jgi:uncharacterized protein YlxW (UPF0749 family)
VPPPPDGPPRPQHPRTAWRLGVPAIAAVAGLLFATSAVTARGTDLRADRRTQISQLITEQQRTVADQQASVRRLQAELDAAGAGLSDPRLLQARREAARLAAPAGLTAVTGAGLSVTLDDAPYRPDDPTYQGVPPDYLVVHQQDVQGVVNALWAGHARAVAIMGHRVVATTVIRCVGNTLWLPGERPYSPPFVVTAVGDPAALRAALASSRAVRIYQQYVDAYRLGYRVREERRLTLPAYDGPVQLLYARVAGPSGSVAP